MTEQERLHILSLWQEQEIPKSAPATEAELARFEEEFEPIPDAYRWFLLFCGGGLIGSQWVDDIHELGKTHQKYNAEAEFWTTEKLFVIGWDSAGSPFGIDKETGEVVVEDHDFGGVHEIAPSFYAFAKSGLESEA